MSEKEENEKTQKASELGCEYYCTFFFACTKKR